MSENYNQDVIGQLIGDLSAAELLRDTEIVALIRKVIAREENWKLYGPLSSKLLESLLYIDHRETRLAVASEILGWVGDSREKEATREAALFVELSAWANAAFEATSAGPRPARVRVPRSTFDLVHSLSSSDSESE